MSDLISTLLIVDLVHTIMFNPIIWVLVAIVVKEYLKNKK